MEREARRLVEGALAAAVAAVRANAAAHAALAAALHEAERMDGYELERRVAGVVAPPELRAFLTEDAAVGPLVIPLLALPGVGGVAGGGSRAGALPRDRAAPGGALLPAPAAGAARGAVEGGVGGAALLNAGEPPRGGGAGGGAGWGPGGGCFGGPAEAPAR